jgi:hypothetical protein
MNDHESVDTSDDVAGSPCEHGISRGGTIDFSVDDGFAGMNGEAGRRRIDPGTMVFAGVVIASGIGLWSMRFLGSTAAQSPPIEDLVETERWISEAEENGAPVPTGGLAILTLLDKDALNDLQVSIGDLRTRTPFRYHGEAVPGEPSDAEGGETTRATDHAREEFQSIVDEIALKMKVSAILAPDTPRSQTILNGFRLTVGDVFEVPYEGREYTFKVERIARDGVTFVSILGDPVHEHRIEVPIHRDH